MGQAALQRQKLVAALWKAWSRERERGRESVEKSIESDSTQAHTPDTLALPAMLTEEVGTR